MCNEMWRDVVSESVQRLGLLQLSGCICHLLEECFREAFKRKSLFNCLKKRYNHSIKTGRCSMDQKEQTKCMGSDGMQKMNGVINADLMTVEEIHQKLDAGYKDMENGRVREASEVFAEFRQQHETK
jgi:hypothetical protein